MKRLDAGCFKMPTAKLSKEGQIIADIVGTLFLAIMAFVILGVVFSGCTVSASVDWNGKTEVKKTTASPTTIEKHVLW